MNIHKSPNGYVVRWWGKHMEIKRKWFNTLKQAKAYLRLLPSARK